MTLLRAKVLLDDPGRAVCGRVISHPGSLWEGIEHTQEVCLCVATREETGVVATREETGVTQQLQLAAGPSDARREAWIRFSTTANLLTVRAHMSYLHAMRQ